VCEDNSFDVIAHHFPNVEHLTIRDSKGQSGLTAQRFFTHQLASYLTVTGHRLRSLTMRNCDLDDIDLVILCDVQGPSQSTDCEYVDVALRSGCGLSACTQLQSISLIDNDLSHRHIAMISVVPSLRTLEILQFHESDRGSTATNDPIISYLDLEPETYSYYPGCNNYLIHILPTLPLLETFRVDVDLNSVDPTFLVNKYPLLKTDGSLVLRGGGWSQPGQSASLSSNGLFRPKESVFVRSRYTATEAMYNRSTLSFLE